MPHYTSEQIATLSKSIALIEKTKSKLEQIDPAGFPTGSSDLAKTLLLEVLEKLGDPKFLAPMDPEVLYNRLVSFQKLVEDIQASTSDHISWPLVSYCDNIWGTLFSGTNTHIFYSVSHEYNYSIFSYSTRLSYLLEPLLPSTVITRLLNGRDIYCLHLASLEEDNLPLYANIGHEFGHALYHKHLNDIVRRFLSEFDTILRKMAQSLDTLDRTQSSRRLKRIALLLIRIAEEIFSDLTGALLIGPAFLLSLYEMAWGSNKDTWQISLSPSSEEIRAYPSFDFRMDLIKVWAGVPDFEEEAEKSFSKLSSVELRSLARFASSISTVHSADIVQVRPLSDSDQQAIQEIVVDNLEGVKGALTNFGAECKTFVKDHHGAILYRASAPDISELLVRLENDLLPNILPDNSLLGKPASFQSILNASAIYRLHILLRSRGSAPNRIYSDVGKVERLTAKALEVSYVQDRFNRDKPRA